MISTSYQKNVVSDYAALRQAVAQHQTEASISESATPATIVDAGPNFVTVETWDGGMSSGTSTVTYRDMTERAHHIIAVEEHKPTDFTRTSEDVVKRTVDFDTGELLYHEINGRMQPLGNIAGAQPTPEPPPQVGKPILERYHGILEALKRPADDVMRFEPLPGEQPEGRELTVGLMHVTVLDENPEHLRTKEFDGCMSSGTSNCSYDVEGSGPYKTLVYTRETPPRGWVMGDKGEKVTYRIDMATGEVNG